MADIFEKQNAIDLLKNKRVVFFGDSNVRHLYKDLIWLLNKNSLTRCDLLRKRGEDSYEGDKLIGPCLLHACRDYRENRKYELKGFNIEFFFITRCLNEQIEEYMKKIKSKAIPAPDVIIMNSTLWDLTRWGPGGVKDFKSNMVDLMKLLNDSLPESTMFIWTTALPPGKNIKKGSLLIKQVEFLEHTVRFDVMEANLYAKTVVVKYGYDVLDLHYHLRMQIHRRHNDGLHYNSLPIRLLTNILLTHIALSWDHPLPQNVNNSLLTRYREMVCDNETETVNKNSINVTSEEENNNNKKMTNKQRKAKAKFNRKKAIAARRKRIPNPVNPPFGNEFCYGQPPFNDYDCFNYNNGMPGRGPFHRGGFPNHDGFNDNQMSQSYNPAFYEDFPVFHDNRQLDIPPLMGNNFVHYRM